MNKEKREYTGAFYTPDKCVKLSQKYLANTLGENWQDIYYIWDCSAGSGNLLEGLKNKNNIWVSTLDNEDVEIIKERFDNLDDKHIFQFDFLNDDFSKLPLELQDIINDEEKRKRLILYINPPYAESSNILNMYSDETKSKKGIANITYVYNKYKDILGASSRELYAQFLIRIYKEIYGCIIAQFSKLKHIQSSTFKKFRNNYNAELLDSFIVPSNIFSHVKGNYPIGFFIWDTKNFSIFKHYYISNVYDKNCNIIGKKKIYCYDYYDIITKWLRKYYDKENEVLSYLHISGTDIQDYNKIFIKNMLSNNDIIKHEYTPITKNNIIETFIYYTIRQAVNKSWINDRDQFLYPIDDWENDEIFKSDCLVYGLFSNYNSIKYGKNNFIPYKESDFDINENFDNHIIYEILSKYKLSLTSQNVLKCGKELYKYYYSKNDININATIYDIKEYFQGRNDKGILNHKSNDEVYNNLINSLRKNLKELLNEIEPKIYQYRFMLKN